MSTESVFITAVIDAHEERDVGCLDIPGAFLHVNSNKDINMTLKGKLAELMVQVALNIYQKYVTVDRRGMPILYVKIWKALYELLRSPLLFHCKLVNNLEGAGFVLNPYDPCVANKMVNRSQMTVCWHVDDLKVLHIYAEKMTKFGSWLNATYGVTMVAHRGKIHDYLGMILDYLEKGKVKVTMIDYIKSIIKDFPEEIVSRRATPLADCLFDVRDASKAKPLLEEQAMIFH